MTETKQLPTPTQTLRPELLEDEQRVLCATVARLVLVGDSKARLRLWVTIGRRRQPPLDGLSMRAARRVVVTRVQPGWHWGVLARVKVGTQ